MPAGHENIIAWQRGMDLAAAIYSLSKPLRSAKHSDLASQLERAAVSIPTNIAEGKGRSSAAEFARFLNIALGSLREVETLLLLTDRLGLAKKETVLELKKQADEVGRVLFGLERSTRSRKPDVRRPKPTSDA
jgi:four helix bundle protein